MPQAAKPVRTIALLHDGRDQPELLEFVIDACRRQSQPVKVDVLLHETPSSNQVESLKQAMQQAEIDVEIRHFQPSGIDEMLEYLQHAASLISLIALADDQIARRLIENVLPGAGDRLYVPIVLIGGATSAVMPQRSAA